ncbi:zinc-ribbon domain-containing protein [Azospirillum sp. sgz302134]
MIITCPTCATRYTLADSAVGPQGRKVRCAKCGHTWVQTADDEPDFSLGDDVTEIRQTASAPSVAKKAPMDKVARKRALIGWGAFAAVLLALGAAGFAARGLIVHLWPPAALFYETIGLPVDPPGTGLQIQNVRSEQKTDNGTPVLVVDGQIINVSDVMRTVPPVLAVSLGQDRKPVKSWTIEASPAQILPGEIATFRDIQRDPGPVFEVMITFQGG